MEIPTKGVWGLKMTEMILTKVQVDYLLFVKNNPGQENITEASKYFACSKVNAKKIMDRMVVQGILFKDLNQYRLTEIGEKLARECNRRLEDAKLMLRRIFPTEEDRLVKLAEEIIHIKNFEEGIHQYAQRVREIGRLKQRVKNDDLMNLYSKSSSKGYLTLYKVTENNQESFVENSMAMMGFDSRVEIQGEDQPHLCIRTKMIEKIQNGYNKKALALALCYEDQDGEKEVNLEDGCFKIPLKSIKYWNNLGNGLVQASINFTIKAQIGFVRHVNRANFVITLNL